MTAALAAWEFLKRLPWKYIAIALAVISLVVLVWRAPWAESRQKAKDAVAWSAEHARAEGFKTNQDKLTAALNHQNGEVDRLKAEGAKRVSDGRTGIAKATKDNKPLSDQAEALRKSAGRKIDASDPCVISNALGNIGQI